MGLPITFPHFSCIDAFFSSDTVYDMECTFMYNVDCDSNAQGQKVIFVFFEINK